MNKKLLFLFLSSTSCFGATTFPNTGGSGGSATNVFLSPGDTSVQVTTNGTGNWALTVNTNRLVAGTNQAGVTVIQASGGTTNASAVAQRLISSPTSTTEEYPLIIQLRTNQSFVVQDDAGNNLFGVRHDAYTASTARHWEINFGSKRQGLIDQLFDIGSGGQIGWRINGDLNQAFAFAASGSAGFSMTFVNTNYLADAGGPLTLFDTYGDAGLVLLRGYSIHALQSATIGAAAGTGGSVGVSIDNDASDLSVAITLITGNAALASGTLFTYNMENASTVYDSTSAGLPAKPVFSAVNLAASGVQSAVYCTSTSSNWTFKCSTLLTANTTYVWNFFNCR